MDYSALGFWTIVGVCALVGGLAACALAGPAGLGAGGLVASVAYFAAGAVIGGALGLAVGKFGFNFSPGSQTASAVAHAELSPQFRKLKVELHSTGEDAETLCFTFPDVDGSSRPVTSLAKNAPKSQGQDLAEAVADVLRFADTRNPGRVFDVSFHGGVTTALKDAILEELRTQGAKAGIADE